MDEEIVEVSYKEPGNLKEPFHPGGFKLGYEMLKQFPCWHDKVDGALFAKGDKVSYKGEIVRVAGVNYVDEGLVEYLLENVDVLVWENEIKSC